MVLFLLSGVFSPSALADLEARFRGCAGSPLSAFAPQSALVFFRGPLGLKPGWRHVLQPSFAWRHREHPYSCPSSVLIGGLPRLPPEPVPLVDSSFLSSFNPFVFFRFDPGVSPLMVPISCLDLLFLSRLVLDPCSLTFFGWISGMPLPLPLVFSPSSLVLSAVANGFALPASQSTAPAWWANDITRTQDQRNGVL